MPLSSFSVPQSTKATKTPIVVVISDDKDWTPDAEAIASHNDDTNIVHPTKNSTKVVLLSFRRNSQHLFWSFPDQV